MIDASSNSYFDLPRADCSLAVKTIVDAAHSRDQARQHHEEAARENQAK
ncbi:MAG: hypothetical protein QOF09_1739 [Alphaproteobacteria bacterium]|jgi:hypothetical protein|nr:hypothetical protein [Alphaproteobacteria bacterium]